mmetsp:Transcript_24946/g.59486  ORF Transcript_24946/g.59486 Transcript_24946/m.59486 type:complete len:271 (-) Transcript_24946:777-1589(-)
MPRRSSSAAHSERTRALGEERCSASTPAGAPCRAISRAARAHDPTIENSACNAFACTSWLGEVLRSAEAALHACARVAASAFPWCARHSAASAASAWLWRCVSSDAQRAVMAGTASASHAASCRGTYPVCERFMMVRVVLRVPHAAPSASVAIRFSCTAPSLVSLKRATMCAGALRRTSTCLPSSSFAIWRRAPAALLCAAVASGPGARRSHSARSFSTGACRVTTSRSASSRQSSSTAPAARVRATSVAGSDNSRTSSATAPSASRHRY